MSDTPWEMINSRVKPADRKTGELSYVDLR
jgi:hypothetical protein